MGELMWGFMQFNCLYRWHATTSQEDEKWVEQLSAQLYPGRTVESVSILNLPSMNRLDSMLTVVMRR